MELVYKVNAELDVPIYQQLVDVICTAIKNGSLISGQQRPTVQMLAKPGMGVDEGYMIVYNEMNRIMAVRKAKQARRK